MKVTEFRIRLYPTDYSTEKEFYESILKFTIEHEWNREDSKGVMFRVGETILELLWPAEGGIIHMPTGSGLSIEVEDVDTLYNELKDTVTVRHELRNNPWGDRSFGIYTPGNYQISFFTRN